MIKEIETMLENGTASCKVKGKERELRPENMPVLMEFYQLIKALGFSLNAITPLLIKQGYNNGKASSLQNIIQAFKRGQDPVQIVGRITLYNVIKDFTEIMKVAVRAGKFKDPDYPKNGPDATEFIRQALMSL